MTSVVFLGGEGPATRAALEGISMDLVIAADSGLDLARRLGVVPHHIVGDFDSVSSNRLLDDYPAAVVDRHNKDKDFTDAELAVKKARELGADELLLMGGGGGRVDHLLAIRALFERPDPPSRWITGNAELRSITDRAVVAGRVGEIVSFFPLGGRQCRMTSRGLKWDLAGLVWGAGDHGISNEFVANEAEIEMIEGRLLVVFPERGS